MLGLLSIVLQVLAASNQVPTDYAFETSELMRRMAYPNAAKASTDMAPSGAYGAVNREYDRTHQGRWYIEEQRRGDIAIAAGIGHDDTEAINRGMKAFEWGFKQQEPDGSFKCREAFHSTSFFVESTAHACLLLQQSPFAEKYRGQIDAMKPKIQAAARWMADPKNLRAGKAKNAPYTHRRYLVAAALGETGVLCKDRRLVDASKEFIWEGIALQAPEGYNPEKGGYDSSYHALGVVLAMRYYTTVADAETRAALKPMLQRAIAWLATRIRLDGDIDPTGNTRTGIAQEKDRTGRVKGLNYGETFRAFQYWSMISGDGSYHQLARRVAVFDAHQKRLNPGGLQQSSHPSSQRKDLGKTDPAQP
jgi:hypothetical protein